MINSAKDSGNDKKKNIWQVLNSAPLFWKLFTVHNPYIRIFVLSNGFFCQNEIFVFSGTPLRRIHSEFWVMWYLLLFHLQLLHLREVCYWSMDFFPYTLRFETIHYKYSERRPTFFCASYLGKQWTVTAASSLYPVTYMYYNWFKM